MSCLCKYAIIQFFFKKNSSSAAHFDVVCDNASFMPQIHEEARKFSYQTGVRVVVAYGGAPIHQQVYAFLCIMVLVLLLNKVFSFLHALLTVGFVCLLSSIAHLNILSYVSKILVIVLLISL